MTVALCVSIAGNVATIALTLHHLRRTDWGTTGELRAIRRHLEKEDRG